MLKYNPNNVALRLSPLKGFTVGAFDRSANSVTITDTNAQSQKTLYIYGEDGSLLDAVAIGTEEYAISLDDLGIDTSSASFRCVLTLTIEYSSSLITRSASKKLTVSRNTICSEATVCGESTLCQGRYIDLSNATICGDSLVISAGSTLLGIETEESL